mgnify:CR=1 FL=1
MIRVGDGILKFQCTPPPRGAAPRKLAANLRLEWQRAMRSAARKMKTNLRARSRKIRDLGTFQNSWIVTATFTSVTVENRAPHWIFVESGRRAGAAMPPVAIIEAWARRKFGVSGLGWIIAKRIAEKGIAPRPVLNRLDTQARLAQILNEELGRGFETAWSRITPNDL